MIKTAYVYLQMISHVETVEILNSLVPHGFRVTRIGKGDRPKKRKISIDEAVNVILQHDGKSSTNWTFVEDDGTKIGISFAIQNDHRWGFSTVSISFPGIIFAEILCKDIFQRTRPFACISGREGMGKDQDWEVMIIGDDCPDMLR